MNHKNKHTTKKSQSKVKLKFTNKPMTAYGGFYHVSTFFERIGLRNLIEKVIPIREISNNRIKIYDKAVSFFLLTLVGADRFAHNILIGGQEVLKEIFGLKKLAKSGSTLIRMFEKMNNIEIASNVSGAFNAFIFNLIDWRKIGYEWIGLDSTVLERYGSQEGSKPGCNPKHKGRPCHSPLLAFLNNSKYVINLWNRPGNCASWNNAVEFFTETYNRVKNNVKIMGILADSGFYHRQFIKTIENLQLDYIIAARFVAPVQRIIYKLKDWSEIGEGICGSEFLYCPREWEFRRRYIVIRQNVKRRPKAMGKQLSLFEFETAEYRYSIYVTNLATSIIGIWQKIRQRSNDEGTIKEMKEDFALGGFCMDEFYSTEIAMHHRVLIYNLTNLFRKTFLTGKEQVSRMKTLRMIYFVTPGYMGSGGHQMTLRLYVPDISLRRKHTYINNLISSYYPVNNFNSVAVGF